MTKQFKAEVAITSDAVTPTKHQRVIGLLTRDNGATLAEMSAITTWLPHSTRAFLTSLKKKGYIISSEKAGGVRRYRTASSPTDGQRK